MNYRTACRSLLLTIALPLMYACGNNSAKQQDTRPPVRVKTLTVADNGIDAKRYYSGTVTEESGTAVSFSAAGTIRTLSVAEGDHVVKGQLIGTIDDSSLRNAHDIAVATLNQARDAYNRMKQLHDTKSIPDIKWVDIQSKLSQAESAEKIARTALDDARLYAPVSGVVAGKMASVGQNVAPGIPVVKIVDISSVKVGIAVPESEVTAFAIGSPAEISLKTSDGTTYSGKLVEKGVVADPLSRSYMVKYQVENSGGRLLPGMICDVAVESKQSAEGIIIPAPAVLLAADNTHFVWLDSAGSAQKRVVIPGTMLPQGIVIVSGLGNGEKVIVAGMEKVSRGTKVTSIN